MFLDFPLNRLENVLKLSSISKTEHVKLCEDFLKNHINVKNFVGIWKISEEYKNQKLIYETKKFALNNFMRVRFFYHYYKIYLFRNLILLFLK